MSIKNKVNKNTLDKVISGGGAVKTDQVKEEWTHFLIRVRRDMMSDVEGMSKKQSISRNDYIRQAISEKLKRDCN